MSREPPRIAWRAVLAGGAVALLSGVGALAAAPAAFPGAPHLAAPLGLAAGGAVAGRFAPSDGALHGGLVAVLWIVVEAVAGTGPGAPDALADTAVTVLYDAVQLAVGALFGWIGARH